MKNILLFLTIAFILNGCASNEKIKDSRITWLLDKQKDNMVFVKGGSFMMGDPGAILTGPRQPLKDEYNYNVIASPENRKKYPNADIARITDRDASPAHKVTLSDFSISKHLVTWEEFDTYYEIIGKKFLEAKAKKDVKKWKWRRGNRASTPFWQEAKNYCQFLAKHSGLHYDLPTEAQWEYAARSRGKYVFFGTDNGRGYDSERRLKEGEVLNMAPSGVLPIGSFPPNPLGLYDVSGTKWQWINDWYDKNYYKNSPDLNPKGPEKGEKKVIRGGSSYEESIVFNRWYDVQNAKHTSFRCVSNP